MADAAPDLPAEAPPAPLEEISTRVPEKIAGSTRTIAKLRALLSRTSGFDSALLGLHYPLLVSVSLNSKVPQPGLRALIALISDVRMFLRLPGLLSIYLWALSTYAKPPKDTVLNTIAWGQIGASTVFQLLENIAYLSAHHIIKLDKIKEGKAWRWCLRAWGLHVFLDLVRLARVKQLEARQRQRGRADLVEKESKIEMEAEEEKWRTQLLTNAAYAPLTIHYGMDKGPLSDLWIGAFGSVASIVGWRQVWKNVEL